MSLELLQTIEQAEARAEAARQDAQREARETVVAAEKKCAEDETRATSRRRAESQSILRDARETSQRRLDQLASRQKAERAKVCDAARARLGEASALIFERIVGDGNR